MAEPPQDGLGNLKGTESYFHYGRAWLLVNAHKYSVRQYRPIKAWDHCKMLFCTALWVIWRAYSCSCDCGIAAPLQVFAGDDVVLYSIVIT